MGSTLVSTEQVERALQIARTAQSRAHAPYSRFHVGAALKLRGVPEAIAGCNVENASYGATVCAERTACLNAVAHHGTFEPEFLVVVTNAEPASPPCALCLQVLAEFAGDDLPIYLANARGVQAEFTLRQLLPHPFRTFEGSQP